MGKGVVPDSHQYCVAAGRTFALQNADLVILLGARLNWILHFGKPPRFQPDVLIVQVVVVYSRYVALFDNQFSFTNTTVFFSLFID